MTANVGTIDRLFRALLGLVLIAAPFVTQIALFQSSAVATVSVVVGLVMLVVAAVRVCPVYSVLGLKTCRDC